MVSDFELLAEKINKLAALALTLRRENAELRIRNAELENEQSMMNERLQLAREKITQLIGSLPETTQGE